MAAKKKVSALQKKKNNPRSKYWQTRADHLWIKVIREIHQHCAIDDDCAGYLECHHLISRSQKRTRHSIENGILLCSKHHTFSNTLSAHRAPMAFAEWIKNNRPDTWSWCSENKHKLQKADYLEAYKDLENWCIENAPDLMEK